jgi:hypothetical protein
MSDYMLDNQRIVVRDIFEADIQQLFDISDRGDTEHESKHSCVFFSGSSLNNGQSKLLLNEIHAIMKDPTEYFKVITVQNNIIGFYVYKVSINDNVPVVYVSRMCSFSKDSQIRNIVTKSFTENTVLLSQVQSIMSKRIQKLSVGRIIWTYLLQDIYRLIGYHRKAIIFKETYEDAESFHRGLGFKLISEVYSKDSDNYNLIKKLYNNNVSSKHNIDSVYMKQITFELKIK